MGSILRLACKCGYESEDLFAGGGQSNFLTSTMVPALCDACHHVQTYDRMLAKRPGCAKCEGRIRFYDQRSLRATGLGPIMETFEYGSETRDLRLPTAGALCPRCGKLEAGFVPAGCWD